MEIREITWTATLAVIIFFTGLLKIPALMPGFDFQLSAPFAVMIAGLFGFRRYFIAGLVSSTISFLLGLANPLNIAIALLFRLGVGGWLACWGRNRVALFTAGLFGSTLARICLAWALDLPPAPLLLAMLPGSIACGVAVLLMYKGLYNLVLRLGKQEYLVTK